MRLRLALGAALLALAFALPANADSIPQDFHVPLPMRLDQGGTPACTDYAGTLAMEAIYGGVFDPTATWNALVARGQAGPWGSDATFFLQYAQTVGIKRLVQPGDIVFRAWRQPDKSARGFHYVRMWWHRPKSTNGSRVRISGFQSVDYTDPVVLEEAILSHGPLLVALQWDDNFSNTYLNGVVKAPIGSVHGLHEIVIFGFQHRDGQLYWDVANSYGEWWGYKGVGYMADSDRSLWFQALEIIK